MKDYNTLPKKVKEYCDYVLNDNGENTGKYQIKAVERFLFDLKRDDLEFRDYHYERCEYFMELVPLWDKPNIQVKVLPFQAFHLYNILSIFRKGTKERKYNISYYQIARKNSKSSYSAQLQLYMLLYDDPEDLKIISPGRQVFCCANSTDQARIVYNHAKKFAEEYNDGEDLYRPRTNRIELENGSFLKVLSSSPKSNDGYLCYFAAIDEYHEAQGSEMLDVMESSTASSLNWHISILTTAGFHLDYPCYKYRNMCIDILNTYETNFDGDSIFVYIFEPDEGDDIQLESTWKKASPSYGTIVKKSTIKKAMEKARLSGNWVNFKTKNLNLWCGSERAWVTRQDWNQKKHPNIKIEDFVDKKCYLGIDLAAKNDINCLSYIFLEDEDDPMKGITVFTYSWIPEESLSKRTEIFRGWVKKGWITTVPGRTMDFSAIRNKINELKGIGINPEGILVDEWNGFQLKRDLEDDGYEIIIHKQTNAAFNKPTTAFETLVLDGKVEHNGNPVLEWMVSNVCISYDQHGNQKPDKKKSSEKIDGVISALQAFGGAIYDYEQGGNTPEIFLM